MSVGRIAPDDHATGVDKLLGHLAALLFAVLIAGSFSIGHKAAPHIGPAALNAIRFTFASLLLFAILLAIRGRPPSLPPAKWRLVILGGLVAVYFITMFIALQTAQPVSTGAMFTLIPLMSACFGLLFLGQKVPVVVLASLLIAATGAIWVIFRGDLDAILAFDVGRGEAIFFLGCVCHAAYTPLVRKFRREETVLEFSLWTLVAATVFMWIAGIGEILQTDFAALPAIVWIAIAYLAVFTSALTTLLIQFAALRLPASKVLAYGYLTPSVVILIEGLSGFGWVHPSVIAGAIVTALALLVMALAQD